MPKPLEVKSRDSLINKSIYTSDGFYIGNIHDIEDDNLVVVKGDVITTVYYQIPRQLFGYWDGHAIWLTIDDKESKKYIFQTQNNEEFAGEPIELELEQDVLNHIIHQAEELGISLTSYINQIIKKYFQWNSFQAKSNLVLLPRPVVKEAFDKLTTEQIIFMAKNTGKYMLQSVLVKFALEAQKIDLNLFLSRLEDEMNNCAIATRHIVSNDDMDSGRSSNIYCRFRHHTFILKHDAGYKYSIYHKAVVESIFEDLLQKAISVTTTDNIITVEFEE